ncbi:S-layer homology domain-containing protein [Blautia liquoris]|uniref:S-layer homology domain-containing protein n=1 Tax=Blautia liquoris TaxID=2779518 RepID=A0A7M2RJ45_9FIRM|nr:S-layer homology domain-containing protein [Blautia liquoris]QOV20091.1 S-layer homology domain-containing protein [Blautia liquoris]
MHTKQMIKALMITISIALNVSVGISIKADSIAGERCDEQEHVTGMDENGNVSDLSVENGSFENHPSLFSTDNVQIVNFNISGSKVTEYVNSEDSKLVGYLNGAYAADGAYLGTTGNGKVKFMIAGEIGVVDSEDVQVVNYKDAKSVSYYTVSGGRLIHKITTNMTKASYASSLDNGQAPTYLKDGAKYYSYDGHYFYSENQYAQMLEDYKNNNRDHSVNNNSPFYNYYQFLPLRSTTRYSEDELNNIIRNRPINVNSKMQNIASSLIENQNKYGVNALLVAGIAGNESAWGTSNISQTKNNLFGLNAVDSSPGASANTFSSVDQCIKEFTETWMSKQYMNPSNWKHAGSFLGNKESGFNVRYASDPYWGEKAAAGAYVLDKNGGNRDMYSFRVGIKNAFTQVNVRRGSSTSTKAVYQTPKQRNTTFIVRRKNPINNFYEIQSDGVLNADRTNLDESGEYNKSNMLVNISSNYIKVISDSNMNFRDVNSGDWYYDEVDYVSKIGIMTGMKTDIFGPMDSIARAQFAVMLWRIGGEEPIPYNGKFPDVGNNIWYTDAIAWASKYNIITGYQDTGKFMPASPITRQELAVMLYRYANYRKMDTNKKADLSKFKDSTMVIDYAKDAMRWAVGSGIITGKYQGTQLDPLGVTSRAECAIMIDRFLKLI